MFKLAFFVVAFWAHLCIDCDSLLFQLSVGNKDTWDTTILSCFGFSENMAA